MDRKDWTLIAIHLAGEKGLTPAQLQKSLFLLCEVQGLQDPFSFLPYNYGPFDVNIYFDAESLESEGMDSRDFSGGRKWPIYKITEMGNGKAKELISNNNQYDENIEYLRKAVEWTQSLSFQELIRAIYHYFPNYKENSIFAG